MEVVQQEPVSNNRSSGDRPFAFFQFDKERGDADQVRNSILVVAALVATATFQAVMSPPDVFTKPPDVITKGDDYYGKYVFFYSNTLACSCAMAIIENLTIYFPYKRELRVSYFAMGVAFAISVIRQAKLSSEVELGVFIALSFAPWIIRWVPYYTKKLCCCCCLS